MFWIGEGGEEDVILFVELLMIITLLRVMISIHWSEVQTAI